MKRLYILTLFSSGLAVCILFFQKKNPTTIAAGKGLVINKEWLLENNHPLTPEKDCRPADQTFLTFPEWYLVFSPEEQATYFKKHTSSSFPFNSHTAQIWESYKIINDQIKDLFPVNTGYHFMIWVIGSSASVEYFFKSCYELIIGRITDTYEVKTDEDLFNAKFTQDYVDFIKDHPWYEFDFKSRLSLLWSSCSFWGDNFLRKIERKYLLSSELLVKYVYGKLIGLGTQNIYEEALPTTAVVIENDSLLFLPRYDKFRDAVCTLAEKGQRFKEIAGNNSAILLTVLLPISAEARFEGTQLVFTQPLASDPSTKRIALAVPVHSLHQLLIQLRSNEVNIEHVFDF